jgi:hypothetical protein
MNRDNPTKHFILAFAIALAGYIFVFHFIEHRRTRKGAWQVTYTNTPVGSPEIVINQTTIGITNVQILFSDQTIFNIQSSSSPVTNHQPLFASYQLPVTVLYSRPKPVPYDVPFGRCVFMDTTFLPGTLTFQFFDHEIELLPRVLVLDRREHPWRSGEIITLTPAQALTNAPARSAPK